MQELGGGRYQGLSAVFWRHFAHEKEAFVFVSSRLLGHPQEAQAHDVI